MTHRVDYRRDLASRKNSSLDCHLMQNLNSSGWVVGWLDGRDDRKYSHLSPQFWLWLGLSLSTNLTTFTDWKTRGF